MPLRAACFLLFFLLHSSYTYLHQIGGSNQYTRLDTLHAIFYEGTLQIDHLRGNTVDTAKFDGHYYSDKPIGIVLLAAPAWLVSQGVIHTLGLEPLHPTAWLIADWITTAGSVGLLTALGAVACFLLLLQHVGGRLALLATLGLFLGNTPFPYATMLFSHGAVVGLLCIALWAVLAKPQPKRTAKRAPDPVLPWIRSIRITLIYSTILLGLALCVTVLLHTGMLREQVLLLKLEWLMVVLLTILCWLLERLYPRLMHLCTSLDHSEKARAALAGLAVGLAVASEFDAAIAAGGILVLGLLRARRFGQSMILWSILPLLLIPLTNLWSFGSPFQIAYRFSSFFPGMHGGVLPGIRLPQVSAIPLLLISPSRGLFFWSPWLLLSLLGFFRLRPIHRPLALTCASVALLQLFLIAGFSYPEGGWALGPRYLAPILPFLALLSSYGLKMLPRLGTGLIGLSILLIGLGTITNPMPPPMPSPLTHWFLPHLMEGKVSPNLGLLLGLSGSASLLPLLLFIAGCIASLLTATRSLDPRSLPPESLRSADGAPSS